MARSTRAAIGGARQLFAESPFQRRDWALLLVAPGLILFSAFMLYPIFYLVYISLTDATNAGTVIGGGAEFIGLENYATLIGEAQFYTSLLVTWGYVGVSLVFKVLLAVGIALLLSHARVTGKRYMRAAVIVPLGFPPIFTITVWRGMFSGARFGLFNTLLGRYNGLVESLWAGGTPPAVLLADIPIGWLSNRWAAFFAYVTTEVWLAYPFMVIIIVSALQDVPRELHDAARVDGAGYFQRFVTVTLPSIRRPVLFASILTAATSFQAFLIPWIFNQGGPARKNELLIVYGYREAINFQQFGLSAAILVTAIGIVGVFMWLAVKYGNLAEEVGST